MDSNTVIQTLLGALLTIVGAVVVWMVRRQSHNDQRISDLKTGLSETYVPRTEMDARDKNTAILIQNIDGNIVRIDKNITLIFQKIDNLAK